MLICSAVKHPAVAFAGLINELESAGQTVVLVVRNDDVLGVIALQDTLRADAATAISELNALGVKGVIHAQRRQLPGNWGCSLKRACCRKIKSKR